MITITNNDMKKAAYIGAAGLAAGAGIELAAQKYQLNKAAKTVAAEAEQAAAPAKKSIKTYLIAAKNKLTGFAKTLKTKVASHYKTLAESGKISKKAIAKSAVGAGILLPILYLAKKAVTGSREE